MTTSGWHDPHVAAGWDAVSDDSPARADQLDLMMAVLERLAPRSILEVGVGSALVARRVLGELPEAELVGIDYSAAMLDLARRRLAVFGDRARLVRGDLRDAAAIDVEGRSFGLAYSVQAIHHLDDDEKAQAFRWLGDILPAGAWFLLRDKVTVAPPVFDAYDAVWRRTGASMPATADDLDASLDEKGDCPAGLESQLGWLRQAGFSPGVLHACGHYALIVARRT